MGRNRYVRIFYGRAEGEKRNGEMRLDGRLLLRLCDDGNNSNEQGMTGEAWKGACGLQKKLGHAVYPVRLASVSEASSF